MIADLREVARRVKAFASQQKTEDEIIANAPDEFLDPIMSCLMTDPVILPSSKIVIDRATIARFLPSIFSSNSSHCFQIFSKLWFHPAGFHYTITKF